MLFNLTYGCFSLFVEIPRDYDTCTNYEFKRMPFPPIPFFTSADGIWDLSENKLEKEIRHSIELSFNSMNDYTENVQTNNENTNR